MPKIVAKKEDWIELAYKLFAEDGPHGIVIDKMAKKLVCNRSSFYWHFKTKKAFIKEIAIYWASMETQRVIDAISKKATPEKRFRKLVKLSFEKKEHLDFVFYLKRYALKDTEVREIIRNIDRQRGACLHSILVDLGFLDGEAKNKSALFYKYLIGYHETIRYSKQNKNYMKNVMSDLSQFISPDKM